MTAPLSEKVEKSLRYSIYDGVFASIMTGLTQEYFAPFLISLQASVRQVGLLVALPNIAAALIQLRSAEISERLGTRKKVIKIFVFLQAFTFLPLAGVALMEGRYVFASIALVTLLTAFGAIATPAWGSMMSDLVAEERRGEYFGLRSMMVGLTTVLASLSAGVIIYQWQSRAEGFGFFLLFVAAFAARLVSLHFLNRMYEPPILQSPDSAYSFPDFIRGFQKDDFARFVVSIAMMNFAVNLAGPFFSVLMLRDLQFSYLLYTANITTSGITLFLSIRRWGLHADQVGNIRLIKTTSKFICFLPFLWVINRNPYYLILVQIVSGFLWAGFNIGSANFIYDAVPSEHRTRSIAYFNVINGSALFAGSLVGGFLADVLPPLFGYSILSLFLLSSTLRLGVNRFMIQRLQEVRQVPRVRSANLFFSMIGIKPLLGIERKTLRY